MNGQVVNLELARSVQVDGNDVHGVVVSDHVHFSHSRQRGRPVVVQCQQSPVPRVSTELQYNAVNYALMVAIYLSYYYYIVL